MYLSVTWKKQKQNEHCTERIFPIIFTVYLSRAKRQVGGKSKTLGKIVLRGGFPCLTSDFCFIMLHGYVCQKLYTLFRKKCCFPKTSSWLAIGSEARVWTLILNFPIDYSCSLLTLSHLHPMTTTTTKIIIMQEGQNKWKKKLISRNLYINEHIKSKSIYYIVNNRMYIFSVILQILGYRTYI